MPRKKKKAQFLIPDQIDGYGDICISFRIPDHPLYIAAWNAVINSVRHWKKWEHTGMRGTDTRARDAAQYVWSKMRDSLVYSDCDTGEVVTIPELRMIDTGNGCQQLQQRATANDPWENLGTPICNGTDGATPECPDCYLPPNEDDGDVPDPDPNPNPNTTDQACQVANAATDYVLGKYRDVLESYTLNVVNNGMGLLEFGRIAQTLLLGAPNPITAASNFFAWIAALQAQTASDYYLQAGQAPVREAILCNLYCEIVPDGNIDAVKLETWKTNILSNAAVPIGMRNDLVTFMASIPLYELRSEAVASITFNTTDEGCNSCCVWTCYEFDFTSFGDGGFTRYDFSILGGQQLMGSYVFGEGWTDSYNSGRGWRGIAIEKTIPGQLLIQKVQIDWQGELGGDTDSGSNPQPLVFTFLQGTTSKWSFTHPTFPAGETTLEYTPTTPVTGDHFRILSTCGVSSSGAQADRGGSVTIARVRIYASSITPGQVSGGAPC